MAARLVVPELAFAPGYLAALHEGFTDSGDPARALTPAVIAADLPAHLRRLQRPGSLWLVEGEDFIGRVSLRTELTPELLLWGGNIGYAIRPGRRRQGFGHIALALALRRARDHGLGRVLLTCDEGNAGSIRIIEAAGAELAGLGVHPEAPERPIRRYWITLGP